MRSTRSSLFIPVCIDDAWPSSSRVLVRSGDLSPRLKWQQLDLIAHFCVVPIHFSIVMLENGEPLRYVFPYGLLPTVPCFPHSVKEVQSWELTTVGRWAERLNQRMNLDLDVTARHSHGRCPIHRVLRHGPSPFKRAVSQENVCWDPWARDGSRETRFFLTYAKLDSRSMYFCCRPMSVQYEDCRRLSFGTWRLVDW
jgi:hypothetical protein